MYLGKNNGLCGLKENEVTESEKIEVVWVYGADE